MSEGDNDPFEYPKEVVGIAENKDALKVRVIGTGSQLTFWVPQSVVHDDSEVFKKDQRGKLKVKVWYARRQKWED